MWDAIYPYLAALLPTIGISVLFYVVIRNVIEADRRERKAQAEWEASRSRETGATTASTPGATPADEPVQTGPDPEAEKGP